MPPGRSRTSCTDLPGSHALQHLGDVLVRVAGERAGADAVLDQFAQGDSRAWRSSGGSPYISM